MGLDFSIGEDGIVGEDTARWSYSGFMRFRGRLWESAGFDGCLEDLYNGMRYLDQLKETHPLFNLFRHSDCDGEICPDDLKKIVPCLEEIIEKWDPEDYDTRQGKKLISNMKDCVKLNVELVFC